MYGCCLSKKKFVFDKNQIFFLKIDHFSGCELCYCDVTNLKLDLCPVTVRVMVFLLILIFFIYIFSKFVFKIKIKK